MATGGPSFPKAKPPVTSSPDCPRCGSLCLGPVIAPCGHVTCRRCLHDALQQLGQRAACHQCGHHLDLPRDRAVTVSELVQQLGTEPILDQLVKQELDKAADPRCLACENKQAVSVCLDCQEFYCDFCAAVHRKGRAGKDHVLHVLSRPLQNVPRTPRATPEPGSRPVSSSSNQSASSLDSIRNVLDPQSSRDQSSSVEWKEWVAKEMGLLQEASREKLKVKAVLQNILSLGQELLNKVNADEEVLAAYLRRLPRLDVLQRTGPGTYVIRAPSSDVGVEVKRESLERRLGVVRQCRQCPDLNAVEMVRTQLHQLLHSTDREDCPNVTFSTPAVSPTYPSPYTFAPSFDVMMASPLRLFTSSPTTADDSARSVISAVVCLPDDRLVMTDGNNKKVKVMGMAPPHAVSASVKVAEKPWHLALLSEGLVAVTTWEPLICLISVTDTVTVSSRIQTARKYDGIAGQEDGHLLVSCREDDTGPAAVHVLTRQGDVVRTVTDSARLTGLVSPLYISNDGGSHVLVADCDAHLVHRVEVSSGHVTQTFDHTDIKYPTQVCSDSTGVVYIVSPQGGGGGGGGGGDDNDDDDDDGCVLVRSRGGQWRRLLTSDLSHPGYVRPVGLCLTKTGRLVVTWHDRSYNDTVVVGYDLV